MKRIDWLTSHSTALNRVDGQSSQAGNRSSGPRRGWQMLLAHMALAGAVLAGFSPARAESGKTDASGTESPPAAVASAHISAPSPANRTVAPATGAIADPVATTAAFAYEALLDDRDGSKVVPAAMAQPANGPRTTGRRFAPANRRPAAPQTQLPPPAGVPQVASLPQPPVAASSPAAAPHGPAPVQVQWIWSDEQTKDNIPNDTCYFRKTFSLRSPQAGRIDIVADDRWELFVNGRKVAAGEGWQKVQAYDISKLLIRGSNLIAVSVENTAGSSAGLAARVVINEGGRAVSQSTDGTWKAALRPLPLWSSPTYLDGLWGQAQVLGGYGVTAPWIAGTPTPAAPPGSVAGTGANHPQGIAPGAPVVNPTAPAGTPSGSPTSAAPPGSVPPAVLTSAPKGTAPTANAALTTVKPDANAAKVKQASEGRFSINKEFDVQLVVPGKDCGSLIAMTFNEFGQIVASVEGGGLIVVEDSNNDGLLDKVKPLCDKVKNCQGLLALNGSIFAVAEGPDGSALYKLTDENRDGSLEKIETILKFKSTVGEHGPHSVVLGPDGLLYILVGNHAAPEKEYAATSPHRNVYEGDLLTPKYEDPGGHAVGIKAPGGAIIRTDIRGNFVELVAGGFRNPYDIAFNAQGELFTHDADMEWDEGSSWYRPTRISHVLAGGEYGWRSGWSKWPGYFFDNLPDIGETGRGSPTGMIAYDHFMYPIRYHKAIFTCDWAQGRILCVKLKPEGAGYTTTVETFLEGRPLNATDIEVGPDGALYFATGGRGTQGGIYRIVWKGIVPEPIKNIGTGITAVIRQPQLGSSWARQKVALLKQEMGDKWQANVEAVARRPENPAHYRTRALDVLQLFGPQPSQELMLALSKDASPLMRAKVATLMGLEANPATTARLKEMLEDSDPSVRRTACESLLRLQETPSVEALAKLLESPDRFESWGARRLLERVPVAEWKDKLLASDKPRVVLQAGMALAIEAPTKENAQTILKRTAELSKGYLSDRDFVDTLRLMQVAIVRGQLPAEELTWLRDQIAEEFPAGDHTINREAIRLIAYLQANSALDRCLEFIEDPKTPEVERVHVAVHLRYLKEGWDTQKRMRLMKTFEHILTLSTGQSVSKYVQNISRDFNANMTAEDALAILKDGAYMPGASLIALFKLPAKLDAELLQQLKDMDRQLDGRTNDAVMRLRIGIVAVLARAGDDESIAYLRDVYERDPQRRLAVTLALMSKPEGDNWPLLVRSLSFAEGQIAKELMTRLATVPLRPEESEPYRHAILRGLKHEEEAGAAAVALLSHWTSQKLEGESVEQQLAAWQKWYGEKYPDRVPAELPKLAETSRWTQKDLSEHVTNSREMSKGNAERGKLVFAKAQCVKCHRYGNEGESVGPDLTMLSRRFQRTEVLEAILFPSHVISDQYASKTVSTKDGRVLTGMLAAGGDGQIVLLQADGTKASLNQDEIDDVKASKVSIMPAGLLDPLTIEEITDLFVYLESPVSPSLTSKPSVEPVK